MVLRVSAAVTLQTAVITLTQSNLLIQCKTGATVKVLCRNFLSLTKFPVRLRFF